jgi:hypothetical protein
MGASRGLLSAKLSAHAQRVTHPGDQLCEPLTFAHMSFSICRLIHLCA